MYDFYCPHCSWGMNREDINHQVHEDNHIGKWDITCNNCNKALKLEAELAIDYWIYTKEAQELSHEK